MRPLLPLITHIWRSWGLLRSRHPPSPDTSRRAARTTCIPGRLHTETKRITGTPGLHTVTPITSCLLFPALPARERHARSTTAQASVFDDISRALELSGCKELDCGECSCSWWFCCTLMAQCGMLKMLDRHALDMLATRWQNPRYEVFEVKDCVDCASTGQKLEACALDCSSCSSC